MFKAGLLALIFLFLTIGNKPSIQKTQTTNTINSLNQETTTRPLNYCKLENFTPVKNFSTGPLAPTITPPIKVFSSQVYATPSSNLQNTGSPPDSNDIFNMVNGHRETLGLKPLEKDDTLCQIAQSRGPEIAGEVASGTIHQGIRSRNLQSQVIENMKYGGNDQEIVNWWLNSSIHRKSIEGDYKYSCVECFGEGCVQLFTKEKISN